MQREQLTVHSPKDVLSFANSVLEENPGFGVARAEL